jgi:hypothetical protein
MYRSPSPSNAISRDVIIYILYFDFERGQSNDRLTYRCKEEIDRGSKTESLKQDCRVITRDAALLRFLDGRIFVVSLRADIKGERTGLPFYFLFR